MSFRDQSADWSWESVIPFAQGTRRTDCHSQCAHWLRNDTLQKMRCKPGSGRCGERTERCRWQKKRSERVAAVKISSVRRKAAQKFWAPQQDHRPLRKRILWCVGRTGTRSAVGRATARVAPTEISEHLRRGRCEHRPAVRQVIFHPRLCFVNTAEDHLPLRKDRIYVRTGKSHRRGDGV